MVEPTLGWRMVAAANERSVMAYPFTRSAVMVESLAHAGWQTPYISGQQHGMSSSASSSGGVSTSEAVDEINAMFVEARDEIEFALEDSETVRIPGCSPRCIYISHV